MNPDRIHHDFDDSQIREEKIEKALRVLSRSKLSLEEVEAIDTLRLYGGRMDKPGYIQVVDGISLLRQGARMRRMVAQTAARILRPNLALVRRVLAGQAP